MKLNKIIKEAKKESKVIDASKMLSSRTSKFENNFNANESFLKEHNNKFAFKGDSFRVDVENRKVLGDVIKMLKENKITYNIERSQDKNYRYTISASCLNESINNLEKGKGTSETLYKVFKKYYKDLLDLNTRMASYINDGKEFVLDDQDYLALGALIDAFDGDPFDDVDLGEGKDNPKKGCAHNPREKKHFIGEIKESRLKEGENPGARVTTLDDDEKIIKERGHVSLSKKGDRYIVRYAPGYYVRDIEASNDDEAIKQFLGESHLKESVSDDDIVNILGVVKKETNPFWRNREELIKQYRELKDKFPNGEIYLKGDEPYWKDDGKKIGGSNYLDVVQMRECAKEEVQEKENVNEELKLLADINDYKPWSGAISLWDEIVDNDKVSELEFILEDIYPDGITMTQLNDLLWFEQDWVREQLGLEEDASNDEEE